MHTRRSGGVSESFSNSPVNHESIVRGIGFARSCHRRGNFFRNVVDPAGPLSRRIDCTDCELRGAQSLLNHSFGNLAKIESI